MDLGLRALAFPILLEPAFLWTVSLLGLCSGVLMALYPSPLVRLSRWSDPNATSPSPGVMRWVLAPALLLSSVVIAIEAWKLHLSVRV